MFKGKPERRPVPESAGQRTYRLGLERRRRRVMVARVLIGVGFFALWEAAAALRWIVPFFFSSPSRMVLALGNLLAEGSLLYHVGATVGETVVGFTLGTLLGVALAVLFWWNRFLWEVAEPYLVIFNSLPKTALAPILIVWIGNNRNAIVAVALLTSVVVTILSVLNGFLGVEEEKIKLIYTFGGTRRQVLQKIVLPASLPAMMSALKINVGLSFVGVMVGEFLVARDGLGYLIVYGSQVFKLDWVMLSVLLLALLAAGLYQLVLWLEKRLLRWRE